MKLEKTLVDLVYNGKSLTSLSAKNTMDIKYTLASEDNSVIRDIEVDDSGNHFIEAEKSDLATFFTQYPDTLVDNFYWGAGIAIDATEPIESDYLYTADDTVTITNGAVVDDLELSRLHMYSAGIYGLSIQGVVLKSITLNGVLVTTPNIDMTPDAVTDPVNYDLRGILENYMSYAKRITLDISVVVETASGQTTLTATTMLGATSAELHIDASGVK